MIQDSNNDPRAGNASATVTGAQVSPILASKAQLGKLGSAHAHHVVEELRLRNVAADVKIDMRKLTEIVKENEHPQWKERQNSMSDDETHDARVFTPALVR